MPGSPRALSHPRPALPSPHFSASAAPQIPMYLHAHIVSPHLLNSLVVPLAFLAIAAAAYLLGIHSIWILAGPRFPAPGHPLHWQRQYWRHQCYSLRRSWTWRSHLCSRCPQGLRRGLARRTHCVGPRARSRPPQLPRPSLLSSLYSATCSPVWLRFRGGKGVATGFGVFLVAAPWAALAAIGVFLLVLAISRYVALGIDSWSRQLPGLCLGSWSAAAVRRSSSPPSLQLLLLIIVKHHSNIRRLVEGTEDKFGAKKATHEPHRHLRFRRMGNRNSALSRPTWRPPDHPVGA